MGKNEPRRTAIYVRISLDRHDGAGVERQEKECRELAASVGWPVARVFSDNDISAFSGKRRPEFEDMLDSIRNGAYDALICWHPDRLYRSMKDLERVIDVCDIAKVPIKTVTAGHLDLSTPSGRMNARIVGVVARHESEHKGERIRAQRKQAAEAGKWPANGIRCFGYEQDGTVREAEAVEIRRIAAAIISGQSVRSLCRDLNERGITTIMGNRWMGSHLSSVMRSPRLAGIRTWDGKEVAKGDWVAILDRKDWEAVCSILSNPSRAKAPGPRGRTPSTLGTAIYRCGVCNEPRMRMGSTGGRAIYRCGNVDSGIPGHVSRRADKLDAYVTGALLEVLNQSGVVEALCAVVNTADDEELSALRAERDRIRPELNKLAELYRDNVIDAEQLGISSRDLRAREAEITAVLSAAVATSPLEVLRGVDSIERCWDEVLTLSEQRAILSQVLVVTILPTGLRAGGGGGRVSGSNYFDQDAIRIELTETAAAARDSLIT